MPKEGVPLAGHVQEHIQVLPKKGITDKTVLRDLPGVVKGLDQMNATDFLKQELGTAQVITSHLGPVDIARNGMSFGLRTAASKNFLVRLYLPSGIKSKVVQDDLDFILNNGLSGIIRYFKGKELRARIPEAPTSDSHFFSSAEIMVRSMTHLATRAKKDAQPLPQALLDDKKQPIGLVLEFDRLPEQSARARTEVVDTFFDFGPPTLGLAQSSGEKAMSLYKSLKSVNSLPYVETEADLHNMLIQDDNGNFLTFNRVGYSLATL